VKHLWKEGRGSLALLPKYRGVSSSNYREDTAFYFSKSYGYRRAWRGNSGAIGKGRF